MLCHFSEKEDDFFPFFTPKELSCPCCGEFYIDIPLINRLVAARTASGKPFFINSAHRCGIHNARVGGVPLSEHKKIAFDISLRNHNRFDLVQKLKEAGFSTFGFYKTFLHTDGRKNRIWYGSGAKKLWLNYY